MRLTSATVNALTTFNQRRLLDATVEASFLIQPLKREEEEDSDDQERLKGRSNAQAEAKRRRRRFTGESSSEESEEDFAFLEQ